MSTVAAILGLLATILAGVFWLMITRAVPVAIGPLYHFAAVLGALLIGFLAYHTLAE